MSDKEGDTYMAPLLEATIETSVNDIEAKKYESGDWNVR